MVEVQERERCAKEPRRPAAFGRLLSGSDHTALDLRAPKQQKGLSKSISTSWRRLLVLVPPLTPPRPSRRASHLHLALLLPGARHLASMSFNPFSSSTPARPSVKYLTADEAKAIDAELMGEDGAFSLDQVRARNSLHQDLDSLKLIRSLARRHSVDGTRWPVHRAMPRRNLPSRSSSPA